MTDSIIALNRFHADSCEYDSLVLECHSRHCKRLFQSCVIQIYTCQIRSTVNSMTQSIAEIMTEKLETIIISGSAQDAAKKMSDKDISSLVVTDNNNKPVGILTERDLVRKVCVKDVNSSNVLIKDILSSPLVTIDSKLTIEGAADTMVNNKVRHLLVVDNNNINRPIGIITATDFASYLKENVDIDEVNAKILESLKEQ
jgi:CBS domain-containing protein